MISKKNLKGKYFRYFSLAYHLEKVDPLTDSSKFIKVSEYTSKDTLHILVLHNNTHLDAEGHYINLRDSMEKEENVNLSNLIFEEISYDDIIREILTEELIFDDELFTKIRQYTKDNY